ncbi:FAD dependent oxidoreductase [Russula brevipes]|nr:FAD dependent oxidoreductase [Russula brevipes]
MLGAAFLWSTLLLAEVLQSPSLFALGSPVTRGESESDHCKPTCDKIARSISPASQVFYPGSLAFTADISHWANSSSQVPVCSVEPGTSEDVGLIANRVPFAVKGGGHATNLGFSSTPCVHISMARFKDIIIHQDLGLVEIGAGLNWTAVYSYIVPHGINVVGGRTNGIGVAGFSLGGGYSFKTNQHGLTIDTVTEYELVLPNGTVKVVREQDEDLWFGLKGGLNNYGIVTKFTLKSYPQSDVWGALLSFTGDQVDPAQVPFAKFLARQHDRRAAQLGSFVYSNGSVTFGISLFYDGPEPPSGLYDELLNLPTTTKSVIKGAFTDFISSQFLPTANLNSVPMLNYTVPIMKAFTNETKFWGDRLSQHDSSVLVIYSIDPFEPDFLSHGGPSAYPPNRSLPVLPSSVSFGWTDESADPYMGDAIRQSVASLAETGIQNGQDLKNAAPYVNYAISGTPLEAMYGEHLGRLREIRKKYDPEDVMGLAGGWKF